MAKLNRVHQKVFANSAANVGQFGSAQAETYNLTKDLEEIQALDAFEDGWDAAVISGKRIPTLEEDNGVKYLTTSQIAYMFQEGIAEYHADTTYYTNSIVKKSGTTELYKSLINDNTGNPLVEGINWTLLGDLSALAGPSYQAGDENVTGVTSTPVAFSVTFPQAYVSAPDIQVSVIRTGGVKKTGVQIENRTSTGFTGFVWHDDIDSISIAVAWLAFGVLA